MGINDFLTDVRWILTSPARRLAIIAERNALGGSMTLMIVPAYFGLTIVGGIYFDRDPFPGYSFLIPLVPATVLVVLKVYLVHLFARLLEGWNRFGRGEGKFRRLLAVFGYTMLPGILASLVAIGLFFIIPEILGLLLRDFALYAISVLIGIGIALFVWGLILTVLAMRTVYRMRDFKLVLAFFFGSIAAGIPALAVVLPVSPVRVDTVYLEPILNRRFIQFLAAQPDSEDNARAVAEFYLDRVVYRFKPPRRFEIVVYPPRAPVEKKPRHKGGISIGTNMISIRTDKEPQILGRIVGIPGDEVELRQGRLRINGQEWDEPYVPQEYRSDASLAPVRLRPDQYLILPENRTLLHSWGEDPVVQRSRILGRRNIKKWPFGWLEFRPSAFLRPIPIAP